MHGPVDKSLHVPYCTLQQSLDTHAEGFYSADIGIPLTQPPISALSALCLCSWLASWTASLDLIISNRGLIFQQLMTSAVLIDSKIKVSEVQFNALRSLTQPCTIACCLYHNTYDPGTSPGSANQGILEDKYLRSNLSRKGSEKL